MPRFAEVHQEEWIAAPIAVVRAQFADLDHHIMANVHPKLRFGVLEQSQRHARFVQEVRLLGIRQRDVFERTIAPNGRIRDVSVDGFNKGGSVDFLFRSEAREGRDGTRVRVAIRLPLPPLIGGLIRPLLEGQVRRELRAAIAEDRFDIEVRGYPRRVEAACSAAAAV